MASEPGQAASALGSAVGSVADIVDNNAVPMAEGVGTVAVRATPYLDIVACPEAITAVAAINIEINKVNEYDAAIGRCPVRSSVGSDVFELATASFGLVVDAACR